MFLGFLWKRREEKRREERAERREERGEKERGERRRERREERREERGERTFCTLVLFTHSLSHTLSLVLLSLVSFSCLLSLEGEGERRARKKHK
jgi:uncharacterized membrane protein YdbT with pleckstrin-like domain